MANRRKGCRQTGRWRQVAAGSVHHAARRTTQRATDTRRCNRQQATQQTTRNRQQTTDNGQPHAHAAGGAPPIALGSLPAAKAAALYGASSTLPVARCMLHRLGCSTADATVPPVLHASRCATRSSCTCCAALRACSTFSFPPILVFACARRMYLHESHKPGRPCAGRPSLGPRRRTRTTGPPPGGIAPLARGDGGAGRSTHALTQLASSSSARVVSSSTRMNSPSLPARRTRGEGTAPRIPHGTGTLPRCQAGGDRQRPYAPDASALPQHTAARNALLSVSIASSAECSSYLRKSTHTRTNERPHARARAGDERLHEARVAAPRGRAGGRTPCGTCRSGYNRRPPSCAPRARAASSPATAIVGD